MRVKRGVKARRRRKRTLELAKGFQGRSKNTIRQGTQRVEKAMQYRFRDRKARKREFRSLWIVRINAGAKENSTSYSELISGLKRAGVLLDRKILAELSALRPEVFSQVVAVAKGASEGGKRSSAA